MHAGTYADYTASKEEWLAKAPYGILLNILGGIPLVALTAFQVPCLSCLESMFTTCIPCHDLPHLKEVKCKTYRAVRVASGEKGLPFERRETPCMLAVQAGAVSCLMQRLFEMYISYICSNAA